MKQLRAEGIQKLVEAEMEQVLHLLRLSREDEELQEAFEQADTFLNNANARLSDILANHRERTDD